MKKYPLSRPFVSPNEQKALTAVLNSGQYSLGPKAIEFEKKFAKRIGTQYACSVSSGTAGLHLAVIAAGIGPGDEVITSPFSFIASSNAILYVGAKPVFCDIELSSYNLDPEKIERHITKKTKAILVVHIFGQAANMAPILRLAKKYKLAIIEDACESIDARYQGKKVGTFGQSGVFAFYPNKQMTTGEGGMIVTNNKRVYDLCTSLKNQGRSNNTQWLDHKYLGYNYRLDEFSAALGVEQLKHLDYLITQRRRVAALYTKYLAPYADMIATPAIAPTNTHTWFVYVVRLISHRVDRDRLIVELGKLGVSTKNYLPSIHLFSFYRKQFGYKKGDFPISESVSDSSVALPFYYSLSEHDIKRIVSLLLSTIKSL